MKQSKPIPKLSLKKLAALKGRPIFSTIKKKKRKPSEFARIYGSKARVEFVKSLPCAACGVVGYSENAHVAPTSESGGAGRKADAKWIAPLCGPHIVKGGSRASWQEIGCHRSLHIMGRAAFEVEHATNLDDAAAETQKSWLADSGTSASTDQTGAPTTNSRLR